MAAMADPVLELHKPVGDVVKQTTCYMCACRCGINVHLRDNRVRYIEGNPAHPVNRGVLCAKGSAGIMQHYSPARLDKPLLRVGERGEGKFREIEWDEALALAAGWLRETRERDPDRLAFFTGRDQSQALTGWWAQQYGTINYAAHGGFCSVNMAAGGLYTLGGSFWEFGEPDWEHSKYLMLWGVAEDHDSNPIKLGLGRMKGRGAKVVAVNPVRTGYGAIADEWIGIRPGTDGLFAFALIHELLKADKVDLDYLVRYTNAHWLVVRNPGGADDGLFARDGEGRALCWNRAAMPHAGEDPVGGTSVPKPFAESFGTEVPPTGERDQAATWAWSSAFWISSSMLIRSGTTAGSSLSMTRECTPSGISFMSCDSASASRETVTRRGKPWDSTAKNGSFGLLPKALSTATLAPIWPSSPDQPARRENDSSGSRQPRQRTRPSSHSGASPTGSGSE